VNIKDATPREQSPRNQPLVIHCEEYLNIFAANEYYTKLKTALANGQSIILDITKVERIDAAMLQLFCSFQISAHKQGLTVEWKSSNDAVFSLAKLTDLHEYLNLHAVN